MVRSVEAEALRNNRLILRGEAKPRVSKDAPEGSARIGGPFEAASPRLRARSMWSMGVAVGSEGKSALRL